MTERAGVMGRIRTLIVGVAKAYVGQGQRLDELQHERSEPQVQPVTGKEVQRG